MTTKIKQHNQISKRPEKVLLVSYYDPMGISTVPETIGAIQALSEFSVSTINLFGRSTGASYLRFDSSINLMNFDVVVIHNTVSYDPKNLIFIDELLDIPLSKFSGIKILMKQDENFKFRQTAAAIKKHKFNIVFTCLPDSEILKIYPTELVGEGIHFERMLTGYVTPSLRNRWPGKLAASIRPIDIGYRGSIQPLSFGRLCYEKRSIGDQFRKKCSSQSLKLDISSRWEDRFGGDAWFNFLLESKCTLGVESGASIFDLDGYLDPLIERTLDVLGPEKADEDYAEAFLEQVKRYENNVYYNQISPRHFEAAACGTLQIMFPGNFSNIFISNNHFIALNRDLSNFDEVLDCSMNFGSRKRIVECAFEEIILSEKNWIDSFVKKLDNLIYDALNETGLLKQVLNSYSQNNCSVLMLAPHRAHLDPRLYWILDAGNKKLNFFLIGLQMGGEDSVQLENVTGFLGDVPHIKFDNQWMSLLTSMVASEPIGNACIRILLEMERARNLSDSEICEWYGAPPDSQKINHFRSYLTYLLDVTSSLLNFVLNTRGYNAVLAADLPTLPAAILMKSLFGVAVIYDAHEYWAENDVNNEFFEREFFLSIERSLVPLVNRAQTVSPGLSKIMSKQFSTYFYSVPNCNPTISLTRNVQLDSALPNPGEIKDVVRFLYQGNFAPNRGLEKLLALWKLAPINALLVLRGPDNIYKKDLIKYLNVTPELIGRVVFLPAVSESDLINAARGYDFGIIPYPPIGVNNTECCPNKLSQYMASGLAILANNTNYVKSVIEESSSGVCVNFDDDVLFFSTLYKLVGNKEYRDSLKINAFNYFNIKFNWEAVTSEMYRHIATFSEFGIHKKTLTIYSDKFNPSILYGLKGSINEDDKGRSQNPSMQIETNANKKMFLTLCNLNKIIRPIQNTAQFQRIKIFLRSIVYMILEKLK